MKITNTSAVIQRLKTTNGKIAEIGPGESKDASVNVDDPRIKAKVAARNIVVGETRAVEKKADAPAK